MRSVLVTGAAGRIGRQMRSRLRQDYSHVRLTDRAPPADLEPGEEFVAADLRDEAAVARAAAGMDAIVHLGAIPHEAPWPDILAVNIGGTYNVFEAARRHGVGRVVFASSGHVVGFHPRGRIVGAGDGVRPDTRYGVSKAAGEALGALYAFKHGLRVLCIRIGNCHPGPLPAREMPIWIAYDDLYRLVRLGLDLPDLRYRVVFGISDNAGARWENGEAAALGYRPQRSAERDLVVNAPDGQAFPVGDRYHGGYFCEEEYSAQRDDWET